VAAAANLESTIIISYPERGLLPDAKDFLTSLLASHYPKSGVAAEISHQHSSLGASKGQEKAAVTEIVYFGTK
jgi:adenine-specific DNA-methyltransferase